MVHSREVIWEAASSWILDLWLWAPYRALITIWAAGGSRADWCRSAAYVLPWGGWVTPAHSWAWRQGLLWIWKPHSWQRLPFTAWSWALGQGRVYAPAPLLSSALHFMNQTGSSHLLQAKLQAKNCPGLDVVGSFSPDLSARQRYASLGKAGRIAPHVWPHKTEAKSKYKKRSVLSTYLFRVLKKAGIEWAINLVVMLSVLKVISRISSGAVTIKAFSQYAQSVFAAVCSVSYLPLSSTVRSLQAPNSTLTCDCSRKTYTSLLHLKNNPTSSVSKGKLQ